LDSQYRLRRAYTDNHYARSDARDKNEQAELNTVIVKLKIFIQKTESRQQRKEKERTLFT